MCRAIPSKTLIACVACDPRIETWLIASLCMTSWLIGGRPARAAPRSASSNGIPSSTASLTTHSAAVVPLIESPVEQQFAERARGRSVRPEHVEVGNPTPGRDRRSSPSPRRGVQVGAERHVGFHRHAVAVDLADHRLLPVEQRHEAAQVPRHHLEVSGSGTPGPVRSSLAATTADGSGEPWGEARRRHRPRCPEPLGRGDQVVTAAESGAGPRSDHMDLRVEVQHARRSSPAHAASRA